MRHLEDLDGKISDRREQIELCSMILNDLLEIQKIVAVGFCFIVCFKMFVLKLLIHVYFGRREDLRTHHVENRITERFHYDYDWKSLQVCVNVNKILM